MIKFIYNLLQNILGYDKHHPEKSGEERPSPGYWISDFDCTTKALSFKGNNLICMSISGTNSMDSVIDKGHRLIVERDFDRNNLIEGDMIVYLAIGKKICHQISKIEEDETGKKYTCWGINNHIPDPYIIRNENIYGDVVAILYTKGQTQ